MLTPEEKQYRESVILSLKRSKRQSVAWVPGRTAPHHYEISETERHLYKISGTLPHMSYKAAQIANAAIFAMIVGGRQ